MKLTRLALPFALVLLTSCKTLGPIGDVLAPYTPKLSFKNLELKSLDFTKIDVEFVFEVHNPNPLSVKLATFSYDLGLEGVQVVKGTNADGLELKSRGDTELAIPVSLTFAHIFELVKATKGKDDLAFSIGGDLGFNTPVGMAHVPFKEQGKFPVVHAPSVSLEGMHIGKVDVLKHKASLSVDVGVANPDGGAAVSLAGFDYGLDLGGTRVAAGVKEDIPAVVGGGKQVVSLPIDIDLLKVGKTLVNAITGKKAMDVKLAGVVQIGTPFGKIPLTFDQLSSLVPH
ncbi:MAG: LEA type 2 family protein [Myxococcota bacterium]